MAIKRFEDIRAWQEARTLTKQVYSLCKVSPGLRRDRRLRDQVQSAAVSVMSNIAEGFSRRSDKEFTQFLFVAKSFLVSSPRFSAALRALDLNNSTDSRDSIAQWT